MIEFLYKRKLWELIFGLLIILCLINYIILFHGFKGVTQLEAVKRGAFFPKGYIIGIVWTILMIVQVWIFKKTKKYSNRKLLLFLILACITYPVYTKGFSDLTLVILGNLFTMIYSSFVAGNFFQVRSSLFYGILLIPIWISFVTYLMFSVYS